LSSTFITYSNNLAAPTIRVMFCYTKCFSTVVTPVMLVIKIIAFTILEGAYTLICILFCYLNQIVSPCISSHTLIISISSTKMTSISIPHMSLARCDKIHIWVESLGGFNLSKIQSGFPNALLLSWESQL